MDNRLEIEDKDEEVKKLQELVKKLELQNEELKRQNLEAKADQKGEQDGLEKKDSNVKEEKIGTKNKSRPNSVEVHPLDLKLKLPEEPTSSDDETW